MAQIPNQPLTVSSDGFREDLEFIEYPLALPGRPRKRICAKKGDLMLNVLQWPDPWTHNFNNLVFERSSRGGTFVEIGANIGTTTVFAADFFRRCYAFEPYSSNIAILQRNLELNEITNVDIFSLALSNAPGTARLYLNTDATARP